MTRRAGRDWWDERQPAGVAVALVVSLLLWATLIAVGFLLFGSSDG